MTIAKEIAIISIAQTFQPVELDFALWGGATHAIYHNMMVCAAAHHKFTNGNIRLRSEEDKLTLSITWTFFPFVMVALSTLSCHALSSDDKCWNIFLRFKM